MLRCFRKFEIKSWILKLDPTIGQNARKCNHFTHPHLFLALVMIVQFVVHSVSALPSSKHITHGKDKCEYELKWEKSMGIWK